ncbi:MAG: DUF421 domain-containing protein [Novosphingobium sp.]|nr:DUF421 domain-containing protein [Novosphingobium sp.]
MSVLEQAFGATREVNAAQECARAALIFVYGLIMVRLAGRRIFGKWAALDIVVAIMAGSNLSRTMTGSAPLVGTLAATTLLVVFHWALSHLAARSPRLSRLLEGRAIDLAGGGRLDERARHSNAVTTADVDEALRQAGIERLDQARKLVLEPSGKISVLKAG